MLTLADILALYISLALSHSLLNFDRLCGSFLAFAGTIRSEGGVLISGAFIIRLLHVHVHVHVTVVVWFLLEIATCCNF